MRTTALAQLGVVAVLAAGCGGSSRLSKSAYEKKVSADGTAIKRAFEKISSNPTSLSALAKQVGDGQGELRKAADDLDAANPPKDVAKDNDDLVKGLRTLADGLEPLKKGAQNKDPNAVRKASTELSQSSALRQAQSATKDMKSKGYAIGALGG
jgi:hypothetical protein